MGRRALRKIDPSLDLAQHLLAFDDLPQPWDTTALFGRTAPLEVEVGTGKGLFIARAAGACPGHDFLGIEIARKYARFAAAKLAAREIRNARVANADGLRIFRELLPSDSIYAVHVYFPDPWWKKRHHKRRVMTAAFVRDVERVLEPDGQLHFWTDVKEYFDRTLEIMADATALRGPIEVPERPAEHQMDYGTHFERRVRLHGAAVYRAAFRKVSSRAAETTE